MDYMSSSPAPTTHVGHGCPEDPTWDGSYGYLDDPRCSLPAVAAGPVEYVASITTAPGYKPIVERFADRDEAIGWARRSAKGRAYSVKPTQPTTR